MGEALKEIIKWQCNRIVMIYEENSLYCEQWYHRIEHKGSIKKLKQNMKRKAFHKNSQQCFVGAYTSQLRFILDSFVCVHFSKYFTLLCAVVVCLPTIQPNTIPLEAAFQGKKKLERCCSKWWIHLLLFLCVYTFYFRTYFFGNVQTFLRVLFHVHIFHCKPLSVFH